MTTKTTTTVTMATAGARKDLAGGKRRNENRRTDTARRDGRTDGRTLDKQGAIEINREYYEKYAQTRNSRSSSRARRSSLPRPSSSFRSLSFVWPRVCLSLPPPPPRPRRAHLQPTFLSTHRPLASPAACWPIIPVGRPPSPSCRYLIYVPSDVSLRIFSLA